MIQKLTTIIVKNRNPQFFSYSSLSFYPDLFSSCSWDIARSYLIARFEFIIILAGDPNKLIRRSRTWEISFSCSIAKDIEVSLYNAPNVIINSFNIDLGDEKAWSLLKLY